MTRGFRGIRNATRALNVALAKSMKLATTHGTQTHVEEIEEAIEAVKYLNQKAVTEETRREAQLTLLGD